VSSAALIETPVSSAATVVVRADVPAACVAAYALAHPDASAYHDPVWLGIIGRAFARRTMLLTAHSDDRVVGVLPLVFFDSGLFGRFAVSLPFVNYGGILADAADAAGALRAAAIDATRSAGGTHLELRHTARLCPELTAREHKVSMRLQLQRTTDAQWQALDRKLRNQVRKAEKSGLQACVGGPELVPEFYRVFARNMRDLGTPVYTRRWFDEVLAHIPTARVVLVRHQGTPAAAGIVHLHRGTMEVPWASAVRDFNPLCANVLLYWHLLSYAIEAGAHTFDFGRSTPGEGTFHFKRQWGAEPQPLVWEYWTASGRDVPSLNPDNPRFRAAINAWQRLPVAVATALGPFIVRHIP
jgi:FemAB-related protein (PEP-CTERM system-associated)